MGDREGDGLKGLGFAELHTALNVASEYLSIMQGQQDQAGYTETRSEVKNPYILILADQIIDLLTKRVLTLEECQSTLTVSATRIDLEEGFNDSEEYQSSRSNYSPSILAVADIIIDLMSNYSENVIV